MRPKEHHLVDPEMAARCSECGVLIPFSIDVRQTGKLPRLVIHVAVDDADLWLHWWGHRYLEEENTDDTETDPETT